MLVLSRKAGDKLVIDNKITITVTKISGNRVTLGIKAPDDVRILRGELKEFEIAPAASDGMEVQAPCAVESSYSI